MDTVDDAPGTRCLNSCAGSGKALTSEGEAVGGNLASSNASMYAPPSNSLRSNKLELGERIEMTAAGDGGASATASVATEGPGRTFDAPRRRRHRYTAPHAQSTRASAPSEEPSAIVTVLEVKSAALSW